MATVLQERNLSKQVVKKTFTCRGHVFGRFARRAKHKASYKKKVPCCTIRTICDSSSSNSNNNNNNNNSNNNNDENDGEEADNLREEESQEQQQRRVFLSESSSSSCISRLWCGVRSGGTFKSRMLRVTQCLLFVLIASCGGLLINKLADNNGRVSKNCSNTSSLQSTKLTEVHLRPVSLKEFKQRLKSARTPYDLLRIFIDRKGLSDKNIKDLINTRTIILSSDYDKEGHPKSGDSLTHPASVPEEQIVSDDATMKANEIDKALAHYHEMSRNSLRECKYPQPEIVHVHDSEAKNFQYIPECTVVYRCRNVSGCCGNASRVCGPKSLQVISRSFFIMIRDGENVEPTPNIVINKEFINHTECECKEIKGLEGCNKDCPYPFRKMRPGLQCICDCLQDDRDCLEIKRGDKPLVENTLKCMKTGKCQAPVCYYGSFNIKTGFCTRAHGHGVRHRKSRRKNFRGR